jgi:hypothetical protein
MCHRCNYSNLLKSAGLEASPNRLRVLEVLGDNGFPLSAADIYETIGCGHDGPESGLPVVPLKSGGSQKKTCPFLTAEGCRVCTDRSQVAL